MCEQPLFLQVSELDACQLLVDEIAVPVDGRWTNSAPLTELSTVIHRRPTDVHSLSPGIGQLSTKIFTAHEFRLSTGWTSCCPRVSTNLAYDRTASQNTGVLAGQRRVIESAALLVTPVDSSQRLTGIHKVVPTCAKPANFLPSCAQRSEPVDNRRLEASKGLSLTAARGNRALALLFHRFCPHSVHSVDG